MTGEAPLPLTCATRALACISSGYLDTEPHCVSKWVVQTPDDPALPIVPCPTKNVRISATQMALAILLSATLQQHHLQGMKNDEEIESGSNVFDVVEIVFQLHKCIAIGIAVLVVNLRPTGDSGLHGMALAVTGDAIGKHLDKFRAFRPRSHDGHIALHDVPELGQLVETQFSQNTPNRRDAWVVLSRPDRAGCRFRVHVHGTKLIERKNTSVHADSPLPVEDRPARTGFDGQSNQDHNRQSTEKPAKPKQDRVDALGGERLLARSKLRGEDKLRYLDLTDADTLRGHFIRIGGVFDHDTGEVDLEKFLH